MGSRDPKDEELLRHPGADDRILGGVFVDPNRTIGLIGLIGLIGHPIKKASKQNQKKPFLEIHFKANPTTIFFWLLVIVTCVTKKHFQEYIPAVQPIASNTKKNVLQIAIQFEIHQEEVVGA